MNNGGVFQSKGASCAPEAQCSQLEVWIGARAHVSTVFVGTSEIDPTEELMKAANKAVLAADISCCLHKFATVQQEIVTSQTSFSKQLREQKGVVFVAVLYLIVLSRLFYALR